MLWLKMFDLENFQSKDIQWTCDSSKKKDLINRSFSILSYEITPLPINSSSKYHDANCPSAIAD